jgi:hypothetical protein
MDKEMVKAFEALICILTDRGLKPQLQRLENEAPRVLNIFLTSQEIDFQLTPPHMHQRNTTACAIQTFKNHFIAGICSVDPLFPMKIWDKLLTQALTNLSLLYH